MVRKTASLLAIAGLLSLGAAGGALAQTSNPCATKNPGAAKTAGAVKDPAAEAAFKQYKRWKKVNPDPVLSASHGNRYVFTYLNKTAEPAGLQGTFPFPKGAVLAKKSFEAQDGKPGSQGPLFIMEKRGKGYDSAHGYWHWAVLEPRGAVSMSGSGKEGSPTNFCAACHSVAKANDYVFGNGTIMKVKPTAMGAPASNPCAAKNTCAAKNPGETKKR